MSLAPDVVNRLAELFAQGATNIAAARELGIGKDTAARYRTTLGLPPAPKRPAPNRSTLTIEQKATALMQPIDGGHMKWTGRRRNDTGTMVMTHHGREYTARRIAFLVRTGREPEGTVTAECDHPGCVAPACVEDEPGRTRARGQLAAVLGLATPLTECSRGHATADHRRYDRDGHPYCGACRALTDARKAAA
ncbi:hypothetical protein [Streptomyces sp. NPDC059631]|uniref:hypothetical protein n=1 Tax=unclassified Streptomyces TaxID=2593676 RepID=UPI0036AEAE31